MATATSAKPSLDSKFDKISANCSEIKFVVFTSSTERKIRHFRVVLVQSRQKMYKKHDPKADFSLQDLWLMCQETWGTVKGTEKIYIYFGTPRLKHSFVLRMTSAVCKFERFSSTYGNFWKRCHCSVVSWLIEINWTISNRRRLVCTQKSCQNQIIVLAVLLICKVICMFWIFFRIFPEVSDPWADQKNRSLWKRDWAAI